MRARTWLFLAFAVVGSGVLEIRAQLTRTTDERVALAAVALVRDTRCPTPADAALTGEGASADRLPAHCREREAERPGALRHGGDASASLVSWSLER